MTPEHAGIIVAGLTRRFGDLVAVDGLSLSVPPGSIYGLCGPDGAGKSSTLRCLAGVLSFNAGTATLAGLDLTTEGEAIKAHLGYMPQRFSLYQELTVTENLRFFADLYQVRGAAREQRLQELLRFSRLEGHTGKQAQQLSGGMKQKLALSCNLIHTPKVLLLDEPTTGVDPLSRREFWRILLHLREQGVAILVSTPYMDEADRCDVVGFISAGRLVLEGAPAALKADLPWQVLQVEAAPVFAAKARLEQVPGVQSAIIHGDRVHLAVPDAAALLPAVREALAEDFTCENLRRVEPSLEDVFVARLGTAASVAAQVTGGKAGGRRG